MSELILPKKKQLLLPPDPKWAPLHYTKPLTPYSRGEDVVDFAASTMTAPRGKTTSPLILTDWQRWAVDAILEEDEDGLLRYRQCILGLPRKQGKSMIGTAIALESLFYGDDGTEIFSAARDRDQAKIVFNFAKKQVKKNPILSQVLKCYRDTIENVKTGSIYKAVSSDAMSFQGYGPARILADEMHGWINGQAEEFWAAMTEASGDQDEALVLGMSTAGAHMDSLLGVLVEMGIKLSKGEIDNPAFGLIWWGADEDADIYDEKTWEKANPNLAEGYYKIKDMRSALKTAEETGDLNKFRRYRLNQWVRTDGNDMYITPFHWKEAERPGEVIAKGAEICVGFDGSVSDDSTAFVGIDMKTGLLEILAIWERDYSDPNWSVPREEVMAAQQRIFEEYQVKKMWCDPAFFQTDVEKWARQHRGKVERIPQSLTRMIPMIEQLKIDIISKEVGHGGDSKLRQHFMNTVQDYRGKIEKDHRGSKRKIDATVCAVLASGARNKLLRRGRQAGRAIVLS